MALYAIGDLHLSFSVNKPMDVFGGKWVDYVDKLTEGFQVVCDDDLCVLCGDLSWGMTLEESLEDFKYIDRLPGKKIILKGNHDYWWTTVTKMKAFFAANNINSIEFLHNNCYLYGNTAICGTRGWLFDDEISISQNTQITNREVMRLRTSLQTAADMTAETQAGAEGNEILCFFHFPPRFGKIVCHEFISVMKEFGVKHCLYGHLHGEGHKMAVKGLTDGIEYDIISADYLGFIPKKVL